MSEGPWIDCTETSKARVHAGWLVDGTGSPALTDVSVHLIDGRVAGIGPAAGAGRIDPSAPLLDFSHCTLLPPLIDAHVHLFMSAAADPLFRRRQLYASFDDLRPAMSRHMSDLLAHGVIAVRDGGDYGGYALRFRNQVPPGRSTRLRAAGKAWRREGRYGRLIGRPVPIGTSLETALRTDPDPVDHVKLVNSGVNSLKTFGLRTAPQFSFDELRAGIQAAHDRDLPVMVHCNGEQAVLDAVEAGCDSVEHGFFIDEDTMSRMAERRTVWVPTAVTMLAYAGALPTGSPEGDVARRTFEHQIGLIEKARRCGVTIAAGTDAGSLGVHHGPSVALEMKILAEAGLSVPEVVRCATWNGARLLGYPDLGLLRPGAAARFLAVEGAPDRLLENLAERRFIKVMGLSTGRHSPDLSRQPRDASRCRKHP